MRARKACLLALLAFAILAGGVNIGYVNGRYAASLAVMIVFAAWLFTVVQHTGRAAVMERRAMMGESSADKESAPLISKPLALSLIGIFLVHTGGAIWWASGMSKDMETVKTDTRTMRLESYTRAEAQLQIQRVDQNIANVVGRVDQLTSRVDAVTTQQRRLAAENGDAYPRSR